MKTILRRWAVAAVAPLLLCLAVPVGAKQVAGEDFEKGTGERSARAVDTEYGRGWRASGRGDFLEFPKSVLNPKGGTIEIEGVRSNNVDTGEDLVYLYGADQRMVLSMYLDWEGNNVFSTPLLTTGPGVGTQGSLWTTVFKGNNKIPGTTFNGLTLPSQIPVGKPFHVVVTWGRRAADCNVYVNGTALRGDKDDSIAEDFEYLVRKTVGVRIGDDRGTSAIKRVVFYDEPIDGADLHANPEKYRPSALNPVIAALEHDAARVAGFSGRLIAGNTLGVTLGGTPGASGSFDIAHYPDILGKLEIDWQGWGVYLEEKVFFEPGEVDLRDVTGYRVYGGTAPFDPLAPGMEPVATLEVEQQSYSFTMLEVDKPYYVAVVAEMRDGSFKTVVAPLSGLPLTESAPGVYTGSKAIGWGERYPRAVVVGHLGAAALAASLVDEKTFVIDPSLTIAVATVPSELKADEKSESKITVSVTDANGNPVSGHKMKFVLATTSQYTGVVGGGAFTEQVGGSMSENRWGETDLFGNVSATYVAGFAAKTAVIVVRDMTSNDTGAGWVKTFITATAQLELLPVEDTAAMDAGYSIVVTSSDEWLTADGKSQARITAKVALNGEPVEGHKVDFAVSSGSGAIRTVKDTTDKNGEARAVYTAGKKIGIVLISATDTTADISGSVSIELRSDAPAKIAIKIDPEKIPADGRSTADLQVTVTDINDNPNDNTEVEYAISSGGGKLREDKGLTDRRGESTTEYVAGRTPGTVSIEITVRSTVPTEEELAKAEAFAVAVTDYKFF